MRHLLIAVAAMALVTVCQDAEAGRRAANRGYSYSYSSPGYTQSYRYTYPSSYSYSSSSYRRPGLFGAIMEFERRKNAFLFGR